MDKLSQLQRSYCMSKVRSKDTDIEICIRSELHARGFRFRKHVKELPGKPDIVFTKKKVAVFIDGDFWHGYRFPQWKDTQSEFWQVKIEKTRKRDQRNFRKLRSMGWTVIRLWQHEIKSDKKKALNKIYTVLNKTKIQTPH